MIINKGQNYYTAINRRKGKTIVMIPDMKPITMYTQSKSCGSDLYR